STNGGVSWQAWNVKPAIVGTQYVVTNNLTGPARLFRLSNRPQLDCVNNLKQISVAFKIWAGDYGDRFPFQVFVGLGGTYELRQIGPDGFDTNTWRHFQVVSNELYDPSILVCPGDLPRVAATNFETLGPQGVTYALRTVNSVYDDAPGEVLAVCPI